MSITSHREKVRRSKKVAKKHNGSTKGKVKHMIDSRTWVYLAPGKSIDEYLEKVQKSKPKLTAFGVD